MLLQYQSGYFITLSYVSLSYYIIYYIFNRVQSKFYYIFRHYYIFRKSLHYRVLQIPHLLHVFLSWERAPFSVALPDVFTIFFPIGKFFLTQFEGLRKEDVVHCTDCKAH